MKQVSWKKCWLAILGMVITGVIVATILIFALAPSMVAYSDEMRVLHKKRFEKVDFTPNGEELIREISPQKPLNLITYYGDDIDVEGLWNSVPEDIQEISIVIINHGNIFKNDASVKNTIKVMDKCDELDIPYAVQVINGETHFEWQVPIAWIEQELCHRPYFYGLNAAELYNGEEWRGQLDGDVALYYNNAIRLMNKYGRFFFWTDTNMFGTNGTIVDWIEENEFLYQTMRECYQNIIMQNKESYGDPSTYSLMKGLYMAKLIGGYGVATDWWHWQVDGYKALFNKKPHNIDSNFERIFYYPENMQIMSLAMVGINGGFCFKNEAEFYSVAVKGNGQEYRRTATFEYATIPFLRDVLEGRFVIPTREQLLENEKFAVVGGENYKAINYDLKQSNLYPNTPIFNIIPLLPKNLKATEKAYFDDNNIKLINEKLTYDKAKAYINEGYTGDTFLTSINGMWLYLNNMENKDVVKEAGASKLYYSGVSDLYISATPHTYVTMKEDKNSMLFTMNNLRLEKEAMTKALDKNMKPHDALHEWVGVDENGKVKADMSKLRMTTIKFRVENNKMPSIVPIVRVEDKHINNFKINTMTMDNDGLCTIVIEHNGYVSFRVDLDSDREVINSVSKGNVQNYNIKVYDKFNANIYGTNKVMTYENLEEVLASYDNIIENYNLYTETSFHAFYREYSKVKSAIINKSCSEKEINEALENLSKMKLVDISKPVETIMGLDIVNQSDEIKYAYDSLMYSLLSPTKHYNGKDYGLEVSIFYKRKVYNDSVYKMKTKEIDKKYNELLSLL